ncbi:hypothetical protein D3C72_1649030 [compost metagenome]
MRVVAVTGDHVPVHVRRHVAETGHVDLFRLHHFTHGQLDLPHDFHDVVALARRQVRHFFHVLVPDHAAKAGIGGVINGHDGQALAAPQQGFTALLVGKAVQQCAQIAGHTSTRSIPPSLARFT